MLKKKSIKKLSPQKKVLINKIHRWAYTDSKKEPQKFAKLFDEIWGFQFGKER